MQAQTSEHTQETSFDPLSHDDSAPVVEMTAEVDEAEPESSQVAPVDAYEDLGESYDATD